MSEENVNKSSRWGGWAGRWGVQVEPPGCAGRPAACLKAAGVAVRPPRAQGTVARAIHADDDATLLERSQELGRGELRALIGVPDFRLAQAPAPPDSSLAYRTPAEFAKATLHSSAGWPAPRVTTRRTERVAR
jgi:hypothetical protein